MRYCLKCKQDWQNEKLQAVRIEAKQIATSTNETMAIEKYGPIYKIVKAVDANKTNTIEHVSKYVA